MSGDNMDMKLNFDIKTSGVEKLDEIEQHILDWKKDLDKLDAKTKGLAKNYSSVANILDSLMKRRTEINKAELKALELQLEQNKAAQKGLLTDKERAKNETQHAKIRQRARELEHNAARLQEDIDNRRYRQEKDAQREAARERKAAKRDEEKAARQRKKDSDYLWNLRQRSARAEAAQARSEAQVDNRRARAARQNANTIQSVNQFLNRQVRMLAYKGAIEEEAGAKAMRDLRNRTAAALRLQRSEIRQAKEKGVYDRAEEQRIQDNFTQRMKMSRRSYNADIALGRAEQQRQNTIHRNRMMNEREFQREQQRHRNDAVRGAFQIGSGVRSLASQGRNAGIAAVGAGYGAKRMIDKGVSTRLDMDTAETNLRIFGDDTLSKEDVKKLRKGPGGLDTMALRNGSSIVGALQAFTEVEKSIGKEDALQNTDTIMGATTALELDLRNTTKLMGTLKRNLGEKGTPGRLKEVLNGIAVAAREDPTQANEIVEGLNRGQGILSMGNMSMEDLTALVSGGQSVGIQPGKAGTFIATLGKELLSGGSRFLDKKKKQQLNFAAKKLGFTGGAKGMARSFSTDSANTIFKVLEALKTMDPMQRAAVTQALSGNQWNDEDLQMLNGLEGMKKTRSEIHDKKNANFLDQARAKKVESWQGMWNQSKTIFSLFWESFGLGFDGILREINAFFLDMNGKFKYEQIEEIVKEALEGLKEGLGIKTWKEGLEKIFPNDISGYGTAIKDFAKGFGEGIKSMGETLRSAASVFGLGGGAEGLGRLAGQLMTLSIALLALSPVMSILGAMAGVFTAIAGTAMALRGIAGMMGTLRLLMAGSTIAEIGALGTGAAAAAGWPIVGTLIATAFMKYVTGYGANKLDKSLGLDPNSRMSTSYAQSWMFQPGGPFGYLLGKGWDWMTGGDAKGGGSSTQGNVIGETQKKLDKIEENTANSALLHLQSYELQKDTTSPFKNLIQKAAFTGVVGQTAAAVQAYTGGTGLSGGGGGLGSRSFSTGGGSALNSSTPGSRLPGTGMRRRGIMGGGGGGGVGASDNSPIAAYKGSQKFDEMAPRIMADLQKDFGLDKESAAAILGNLGHESGGFRFHQEVNPRGGGRGGIGWAQWTGPRRRQYEKWCADKGLDPKSYEANYSFLRHELQTTEKGAMTKLRAAKGQSLEGKTAAFEDGFERAGVKAYGSRNKFARRAMGLPDAKAGVTGPTASAIADGKAMKDVGAGITSSGWKKASDAVKSTGDLAKKADVAVPEAAKQQPNAFGGYDALGSGAPTKSLGGSTPIRPQGGGGGGKGPQASNVNSQIHINGYNKSPEELAGAVQRHLQDSMNRRTHDFDGFA